MRNMTRRGLFASLCGLACAPLAGLLPAPRQSFVHQVVIHPDVSQIRLDEIARSLPAIREHAATLPEAADD